MPLKCPQVRIKESERDALRFHWRRPENDETSVYRFTRALFDLTCSSFLLGGVLEQHLKSWEAKYPNLVDEVRKGLYVDDLMTGGATEDEVNEKKAESIEIFEDTTFKLHKWDSNVETLEALCSDENYEIILAKRQLGSRPETELLGLGWDKRKDSISVVKPDEVPATTKRNALSQLAKLYDPLGLVSPMKLLGKNLFRDMCESRISWDVKFAETMVRNCTNCYRQMPENYEVPRSLVRYQQPVPPSPFMPLATQVKLLSPQPFTTWSNDPKKQPKG